jgi:hypothetical protein
MEQPSFGKLLENTKNVRLYYVIKGFLNWSGGKEPGQLCPVKLLPLQVVKVVVNYLLILTK